MTALSSRTKKPALVAAKTGRDNDPVHQEGAAVMVQRTEEEPFTRVKCTVPWCAHECTWRPDGEGWSRLHRVGVDGLVEVFAGETYHAGEGTELTPASVIVLGDPEELESAENTRDLAAALGRAALIQANHRVVAR